MYTHGEGDGKCWKLGCASHPGVRKSIDEGREDVVLLVALRPGTVAAAGVLEGSAGGAAVAFKDFKEVSKRGDLGILMSLPAFFNFTTPALSMCFP
jgi:hypothetical protein